MNKKITFLALALCAAAGSMAQDEPMTFADGGFIYRPLWGTEVAVAGCSLVDTIAVVPATVEHEGTTYTVVSVDDEAFSGISLPAISLPETVVHIGSRAFIDCYQTTFIRIPSSVQEIGADAFRGCSALGHVELPQGLTKLEDGVLANCGGIYTLVTPPMAGVQSIGAAAFAGLQNLKLDLSEYRGEIGPCAFKGCSAQTALNLPADNPYVRTAAGGQVLYNAGGELIDVLPGATELVIPYPNTGSVTYHERDYYPLQGTSLPNVRKMEVPHTWTTSLGACDLGSIEELTVRAATPFELPWILSVPSAEKPRLYLFDYAREAFLTGYNRGITDETVELLSIDRPTEELYMQEVVPMYEGMTQINGHRGYIWTADWNAVLEEQYPEYFMTLNEQNTYPLAYRSFMMSRYMTDDKIRAYNRTPDAVVKCLDGILRVGSDFDANDYVNWYLQTDTVFADVPYSDTPNATLMMPVPMEADSTVQAPGGRYWLLGTEDTAPRLDFALNLLPGVPYDIYLLMASNHPWATGDIPCNNKVRCQLTYSTGEQTSTRYASTARTDRVDLDVVYSGMPQEHLLWENLEVGGDCYNVVNITSSASSMNLRRDGYTHALPVVGFRIVPKKEIVPLPSAVESLGDGVGVAARYDLQGRRLAAPQRGVNLLRMSDGTTRKVVVTRP